MELRRADCWKPASKYTGKRVGLGVRAARPRSITEEVKHTMRNPPPLRLAPNGASRNATGNGWVRGWWSDSYESPGAACSLNPESVPPHYHCERCGDCLFDMRDDAVYCSSACRQAAYRERQRQPH
jgi:hypothetical protein